MLFRLTIFLFSLALSSPIGMILSTDHCYTDIGCFPITPDFYHPRYRPINVRPWHRSRIKTTFTLFNRQQTKGFVMLPWDHLNLHASRFNPFLETKIIIPGWLDNMKRTLWVKKIKDTFLWLWDPVNIIIVEWKNFTPYTIATANTRVVGAEMANMLKFIEEVYNYKRAYYHLIGHSLGAHISAYCGDRFPGLGRITALDPARPYFQGMPKSVRLDRGDARFVDVIHSDFTPENAFLIFTSFGITTPVGHADFFPNGPSLLQPGCFRDTMFAIPSGIDQGFRHGSLSIGFMEAVRYLIACDHQRSHEWFLESLFNQDCMFVGVRCSDYDGVINGRCSCDDSKAACAIMGIHADQMYIHGLHNDMPLVQAKNELLYGKTYLNGPSNYLDYDNLSKAKLKEHFRDGVSESGQKFYSMHNNHANLMNTQPKLLSDIDYDIESWYENNNKWFLMTNNRRSYCVHQYQVLIFIGKLNKDRIKGNLILSMIGSEGRLINQRFVPRSGRITSHTLQPFYVIFESAFSLGTIKSVTIGWEPRKDKEPIKAELKITSSNLIDQSFDKVLPTININLPYIPKVFVDPSEQSNYQSLEVNNPYNLRLKRSDTLSIRTLQRRSGTISRSVQQSIKGDHLYNSDQTSRQARGSKIFCSKDLASLHSEHIQHHRVTSANEPHRFIWSPKTNRRNDFLELGYETDAGFYEPIEVEVLDELHASDTYIEPVIIKPLKSVASLGLPNQRVPSHKMIQGDVELENQGHYNSLHSSHQFESSQNEIINPIGPIYRTPTLMSNTHVPQVKNHYSTFSSLRPNKQGTGQEPMGISFSDTGGKSLVINQIRITPIQAYYGLNLNDKISKTFCPPHRNYPIPREQTLQFRMSLGNCFAPN